MSRVASESSRQAASRPGPRSPAPAPRREHRAPARRRRGWPAPGGRGQWCRCTSRSGGAGAPACTPPTGNRGTSGWSHSWPGLSWPGGPQGGHVLSRPKSSRHPASSPTRPSSPARNTGCRRGPVRTRPACYPPTGPAVRVLWACAESNPQRATTTVPSPRVHGNSCPVSAQPPSAPAGCFRRGPRPPGGGRDDHPAIAFNQASVGLTVTPFPLVSGSAAGFLPAATP